MLPLVSALADSHDFVVVIQINTNDRHRHSKDLGLKWQAKVIFHHSVKASGLFRLAIGIRRRFFNQFAEPLPA